MKTGIDLRYRKAFTTAIYVRSSNMIAGFIDGILTGIFLGVDAMTAYGIAVTYFSLNTIVSYMFITGSQVLCSGKIGQNRMDEAQSVFALSIWLVMIISVLISIAGIVFAEPFAVFLGARGEAAYLVPETAGYLRFLFAGTIFHNFISLSAGILQIDGGTKLVRLSGITICAADIAGDLLNIFLFKGGLAGMGAATAISSFCAAVVLLPYFFRRGRLFSLDPRRVRLKYLPELLRLGYSQTVYGFASFFGNTAINRLIISRAGLGAMFGMTVFKNIVLFINPLCCAVGDANLLLMGLSIGEGDREGVDRVFRDSLRVIACLVPVGLLLMLLSHPFAYLYTADHAAETVRCAQTAIIALGIQVPCTALFLAALKGLQALRNTAASSWMNLAKACVFPCGLLLVLAGRGNAGVFAAIVGAEALSAALTTVLFVREKRRSRLLDIPEEDRLSATITTAGETVAFSSAVAAFCTEHGASGRTSYHVSLCVEELAICLIQYGERSSVRTPTVHIKLLLQDRTITMRIRDNCPLNDLRKRAEEWSLDDEHPERFIGTRMAMKLSDKFLYIPLMDQSNTIVTFHI